MHPNSIGAWGAQRAPHISSILTLYSHRKLWAESHVSSVCYRILTCNNVSHSSAQYISPHPLCCFFVQCIQLFGKRKTWINTYKLRMLSLSRYQKNNDRHPTKQSKAESTDHRCRAIGTKSAEKNNNAPHIILHVCSGSYINYLSIRVLRRWIIIINRGCRHIQ